MSRRIRGLVTVAGVAFLEGLAARRAHAAPQLSTGVNVGAAANGDSSRIWDSTGLALGLRAELLVGRGRDADWGFGPYVDALTTAAFSDGQLGGGTTLLVPIHPYLPLTLSAGGFARRGSEHAWEPGIGAELFWGSHGYNYQSIYALTAGLFVGTRYSFGETRRTSVIVGARIDLELVALPFLILWQAIQGGDPAR